MITAAEFWAVVRGVRVEDDKVVITMKGGIKVGNTEARRLCEKFFAEQEHTDPHGPGGNPNAFNKWS